jgi:hypothetical protein
MSGYDSYRVRFSATTVLRSLTSPDAPGLPLQQRGNEEAFQRPLAPLHLAQAVVPARAVAEGGRAREYQRRGAVADGRTSYGDGRGLRGRGGGGENSSPRCGRETDLEELSLTDGIRWHVSDIGLVLPGVIAESSIRRLRIWAGCARCRSDHSPRRHVVLVGFSEVYRL